MRNSKILNYWDCDDVESMYDKYLLKAEIALIKGFVPIGAKILDAGCGEGEGTFEYSSVKGVVVHAADFSGTRLKKAAKRLKNRKNVIFKKIDFLKNYTLDKNYDVVVSQRFLINLPGWNYQKKVLIDLMGMLKPGGILLMLEGSIDGVNSLNKWRSFYGLPSIPIKWHNYFFKDTALIKFMIKSGYSLLREDGFGSYFLMTRGIRPVFDKKLNWHCDFNRISSSKEIREFLNLGSKYSRLKLWIFKK